MTVKHDVLKTLEENRGTYFSGEVLAKELEISRAAVWKAINQLKKEGYKIDAVPNRGYSLSIDTDVLSREGIEPYLFEENRKIDIRVYKTLESTNEKAKQIAIEGGEEGTIILSEEQTKGKGRRGRKFYSPTNSGIYMSIILRPDINISEATLITTAASVALCKAIEKVTNIKAGIKWVNDIYIKKKKVAGILTEAVTDFESGKVEWVILGMGLNFNMQEKEYPEEIKDIAIALFSDSNNNINITRNRLIAEIINEVYIYCKDIKSKRFIDEYRSRSLVIGKEIWIYSGEDKIKARAKDIDDKGGLIVQYEDGTEGRLNSGEISIRWV